MSQWVQDICEQASVRNQIEGNVCKSVARQWNSKIASEGNSAHWKSASILEGHLNQTNDQVLKNIGDEKEEMWASLVGQCQQGLTLRCEIPYVCARTLLDPMPRSQYQLTHQLLHRVLLENSDCPSSSAIKSIVTEEDTYNSLCSKIYMEAKYLDVIEVPAVYRDLFSEMGENLLLKIIC